MMCLIIACLLPANPIQSHLAGPPGPGLLPRVSQHEHNLLISKTGMNCLIMAMAVALEAAVEVGEVLGLRIEYNRWRLWWSNAWQWLKSSSYYEGWKVLWLCAVVIDIDGMILSFCLSNEMTNNNGQKAAIQQTKYQYEVIRLVWSLILVLALSSVYNVQFYLAGSQVNSTDRE